MWDLIVAVPDLCLSFYSLYVLRGDVFFCRVLRMTCFFPKPFGYNDTDEVK